MTEDQDTRLSTPILSTPIVSPPASALRSTPIPGDIADGDTAKDRCDCGEDTIIGCGSRPDRCCGLNADEDTVTITISREDAEAMADFFTDPSERFLLGRVALACQAALEGER